MSLNSTMTNMANKIRNILGVENTMGLSAMVTHLGSIEGCIDNAYTAVESKGGTIPEFKIAGMLHHAINSIPTGAIIQRTEPNQSFRTNYSGTATVNIGFEPDLVVITGQGTSDGALTISAYPFLEAASTKISSVIVSPNTNSYLLTNLVLTKTSTGFSATAKKIDYNGNPSNDTNRTISYIAVKYADSDASGGDNGSDSGSTNTYVVIPNTAQYGASAWTTGAGYVTPTVSNSGAVFDVYTESNNYSNTFVYIDVSAFSTMKIVGNVVNESSSSSSSLTFTVGLYDSNYNFVTGYSNTLRNGSSGTINNTYDISGLSGTYAFAIVTSLGSASSYHHTTVTINQLEFS